MGFRLSLPKLVCYLLIALVLLLFTHNVFLRKNGPPKWLSSDGNCGPQNNIAFLKTHKCASSAIQNILFRYGFTTKLHFALPSVGNYFREGIIPFYAEMINKTPWHALGQNIFAVHTKWDHQQVVSVMPNDTIFITIVREPTELFESLFVFTKMEQHLDKNLESYIQDVSVDSPRWQKYLGFNQMTWDFGLPGEHINNMTSVKLLVEQASAEFDLVMVAERMDESLVLLSHLLCWSLEDVLVLKINARVKEHKKSISEESKKILIEKQKPDHFLYDFFIAKFDNLVEAFGHQRMAQEVSKLQHLQEELLKNCNVLKDKQENIKGANKPWSNMVDGYQSSSNDSRCSLYTKAELPFIDLLRGQQRQEVLQRFGSSPSMALNDLQLGQQPLGVNDIERLKKMLVHRQSPDD